MTREQVLALLLAALLLFWVVGAYNRMVGLRNAIGEAWAKVEEALRPRGEAAAPLIAALRDPLAAEHGALDALVLAHAQAARAAAMMRTRPVGVAQAAGWAAAESALSAAASRVLALLEQQPELLQQASIAGSAAAWRDAHARLAFARQLFNVAAETYDEAIALFPTRLLVRAFGFGPAGRI
jgi:LemA protein